MTIFWKDAATTTPATGSTLRTLTAAGKAMARALVNRRAALRISDLPDELLNDIGLRRDDVHEALKTNWREDPTYRMAVAARRRRHRTG